MAEITGRQVFAVTAGAFAIIIAVNVLMAYKAVSTFPGLEVKNSYVASQQFETNRDAQDGLGWQLRQDYRPGEGLVLTFTDAAGLPVKVEGLTVLLGRPTSAAADQQPDFVREGGVYLARVVLEPGKWMLHVTARAEDGTPFQQRLDLMVEG
ncbi:FixH family protein [Gemmobacter serpentinus]|uniref:FixH family protein n=1 Tax=Gemmobacter serpentinus TaxID=2652247 RepID=UPI00124CFFF1|nr:FixH family protein [Gemmobacter serpentinus]